MTEEAITAVVLVERGYAGPCSLCGMSIRAGDAAGQLHLLPMTREPQASLCAACIASGQDAIRWRSISVASDMMRSADVARAAGDRDSANRTVAAAAGLLRCAAGRIRLPGERQR